MQSELFKSFLLSENEFVLQIVPEVNELALSLLLLMFVVGVFFQLQQAAPYKDIFIRSLFALIVINYGKDFVVGSVDLAFEYSNNLFKKSESYLHFINYKTTVPDIKKDSFGESLVDFASSWLGTTSLGVTSKIFISMFWNACSMIFAALKVLYTFVFHFCILSLGLGFVLGIPQGLSHLTAGLVKTYLWLVLMPIFVGIALVIVGAEFEAYNVKDIGDFGLSGLFKLFLSGLFILFAPVVTSAFIAGQSMGSVAKPFSKVVSLSTMLGASKYLFTNPLSKSAGGFAWNNLGGSRAASSLGNNFSSIRNRISNATDNKLLSLSSKRHDSNVKNPVLNNLGGGIANKLGADKINPHNISPLPSQICSQEVQRLNELKQHSKPSFDRANQIISDVQHGRADLANTRTTDLHNAKSIMENARGISGVPNNFRNKDYFAIKGELLRRDNERFDRMALRYEDNHPIRDPFKERRP